MWLCRCGFVCVLWGFLLLVSLFLLLVLGCFISLLIGVLGVLFFVFFFCAELIIVFCVGLGVANVWCFIAHCGGVFGVVGFFLVGGFLLWGRVCWCFVWLWSWLVVCCVVSGFFWWVIMFEVWWV